MTGKPSPLNSSFRLSYYTLLNLMRRVEDSGHDQEYVIARSFQQFQFERSLPEVGVMAGGRGGAGKLVGKGPLWRGRVCVRVVVRTCLCVSACVCA